MFFGELAALILQIAFGAYLAQIAGGIPMSQGEQFRLSSLGVDSAGLREGAAAQLIAEGNTGQARARLVALMRERGGATMFGARSGCSSKTTRSST